MKIFATGEQGKLDELREVIHGDNDLHLFPFTEPIPEHHLGAYDLIIDLNLDDDLQRIRHYAALENKMVLVSVAKTSLDKISSAADQPFKCMLIGMNALPTFINRPTAELCFLKDSDEISFHSTAKQLGWKYLAVADRVGMVTPRVIMMVINEACQTLYEGTASMNDIDKAMRLGTNYPYGPFEWCDRIGIKDVYETLEAIGKDMGDERYGICPLLEEKYLLKESFYHNGIR